MNWVDIIVIAGFIPGIYFGLKKGFVREVMGVMGFILGIIIAINYVDWATAKVTSHAQISTQVVSFLSFIFLFLIVFLSFKILGFIFYKIASLQPLGKIDQLGGGMFGFLQSWFAMGFILFLLMFLPIGNSLNRSLDNSFFAPILRASIPFVYEESTVIHPDSDSMVAKLKKALLAKRTKWAGTASEFSEEAMAASEQRLNKLITRLEKYFGTGERN
ncbi:MAG TPA: CvpA family protein [candidate division Zixibacteria bacterium]|nr:CvpA family protein [candidate division Zixibacteria bacterium]